MDCVSTTKSLSKWSNIIQSVIITAMRLRKPPLSPSASPAITAISTPSTRLACANNTVIGELGSIASIPGINRGSMRFSAISKTIRRKADNVAPPTAPTTGTKPTPKLSSDNMLDKNRSRLSANKVVPLAGHATRM